MFEAIKLIPFGAKIGIFIAFLAALAGLYYVGYNKGLNVSAVEIAKYEGEVSKLNEKLATRGGEVRVETVTKYLQGETIAGETVYRTRTVVKTVVPEQYTLSKGWVYAYNQSVLGVETDPALAADATPSDVTDKEALEVITDNNAISLANARQLDALTGYLDNMEKVYEEVNGRPSSADDERVR